MCPYAKFQSAMFDDKTMIVAYDEQRGEPRGKMKKNNIEKDNGHCIDCNQCVVVCPQDIDIRNGLQMECISCGLCVDACNEVMSKFNLPPNLIRYSTVDNKKFSFFRPRTIFYLIISIFLAYIISFGVINKNKAGFLVQHLGNPLWVMMSNGQIRNSYKIIIENKTNSKQKYSLEVIGLKQYKISNRERLDLQNIEIESGAYLEFIVYLTGNDNNKEIYFKIKFGNEESTKKAFFITN
jgi:cytochrome c oxidase accessory protein FixG